MGNRWSLVMWGTDAGGRRPASGMTSGSRTSDPSQAFGSDSACRMSFTDSATTILCCSEKKMAE
jgi:hypothetical protein